MTNRLFIALKFPEEITEEIVRLRKEAFQDYISLKWEPQEKLHLTLKFLDDVEISKIEKITETIKNTVQNYEKIKAEFDRFGFFLPRILWLGLRVDEHLFSLVKDLNISLKKLNFEQESRNFKPHITILRIKEKLNPEFVESFKNFKIPSLNFQMKDVVLMKSELQKGGSIYNEISSFYLK